MLRGFPSRRDLGRARIQTGKQIQSRPHRDAAQACQPPALFQKEFQTVSPAPIYPECPGGGSHAPCSARRLGSWLWPGGRCSDLCRSFLRLIFMDGLPWCPSIWCCPRSAEIQPRSCRRGPVFLVLVAPVPSSSSALSYSVMFMAFLMEREAITRLGWPLGSDKVDVLRALPAAC